MQDYLLLLITNSQQNRSSHFQKSTNGHSNQILRITFPIGQILELSYFCARNNWKYLVLRIVPRTTLNLLPPSYSSNRLSRYPYLMRHLDNISDI
jgi:hypothetical protein